MTVKSFGLKSFGRLKWMTLKSFDLKSFGRLKWMPLKSFDLKSFGYMLRLSIYQLCSTCQSIGRTPLINLSLYSTCQSIARAPSRRTNNTVPFAPRLSAVQNNNNNNNTLHDLSCRTNNNNKSLYPLCPIFLEFQHPVFPVCCLADACFWCSLFQALSVSSVLLSCCCSFSKGCK